MSQWNQLADIFGCSATEDAVPECAADNICIAWPSIIQGINNTFPDSAKLKALDFGCGGGMFANKLLHMGFEVTGYDNSKELIKKACINTPDEITITSSTTVVAHKGKYDLIVSIMVLPFIEDINSTISNIISHLNPNGLVIYAVFNPQFIQNNLNDNVFTGTGINNIFMELKEGIKIPAYIREESEYREIFNNLGCNEVYLDYPKFTDEFLHKYHMPFSTDFPEYLIQAFRMK